MTKNERTTESAARALLKTKKSKIAEVSGGKSHTPRNEVAMKQSSGNQAAKKASEDAEHQKFAEAVKQQSRLAEEAFDRHVAKMINEFRLEQRGGFQEGVNAILSHDSSVGRVAQQQNVLETNIINKNAQEVIGNTTKLLGLYKDIEECVQDAKKKLNSLANGGFQNEIQKVGQIIDIQERKTSQDIAALLNGKESDTQAKTNDEEREAQELWDCYANPKRKDPEERNIGEEDGWVQVVKRAEKDVRNLVRHLSDHESDNDDA
ncbi:uncharacterized protein KY384_004456 [Bacidia gigantensis]|uniref:uncharacterized protein n=1 Tax=Bacidia gigantensis TaxID=2732470 RepID=UPI001D059E71|nr:uncharacterized protein KY384_004456 [Bacidia gigantensis]KAG8531099.1 hypothetical protein KY384_004456 [Bacidia gigantensis]